MRVWRKGLYFRPVWSESVGSLFPVNRMTDRCKTLPSRNFISGGNNIKCNSHFNKKAMPTVRITNLTMSGAERGGSLYAGVQVNKFKHVGRGSPNDKDRGAEAG